MDGARILAALESRGFAGVGRPLTVRDVTVSTNDDARLAADGGAPHGATYVADQQSAGRGRQGRAWHSPAGQNIYASSVLRLALPAAALPPLALAVGVAVARTCDEVLRKNCAKIKWPNDVYLDTAKVAGVLVETTSGASASPVAVAGIGLNVSPQSFPDDLAAAATTLGQATGDGVRDEVAAILLHHVGVVAEAYRRDGLISVLAELRRRDFLEGRNVVVDDEEGEAMGIAEDGCLRVRFAGGERDVLSGEIRWR
jgi:BirA family transcriptional regulator, biotin operon repressor / biotin---[acetyl-CoA-carboxylase] ligase